MSFQDRLMKITLRIAKGPCYNIQNKIGQNMALVMSAEPESKIV